jgi:hypothetical protein
VFTANEPYAQVEKIAVGLPVIASEDSTVSIGETIGFADGNVIE